MPLLNQSIKAALFIFFVSSHAISADFGTFILVKGKVYIEDSNTVRTEARVNSKIYEGQMVVTEADSRAKIVMSDRNIINVLPNTKLKIEKYRGSARDKNVSLNLIEGRVRTNIEQSYDGQSNKFEIRTSTAVAGVRGTQFMTSYDTGSKVTEILTFEGRVTLKALTRTSGNSLVEISVSRGERLRMGGDGQASEPSRIPKQELKLLDKETNVTDEEKRKKMDQTKNEDSENIVGGVNSNPLTPQENLKTRNITNKQNDGKTRVNISIDN